MTAVGAGAWGRSCWFAAWCAPTGLIQGERGLGGRARFPDPGRRGTCTALAAGARTSGPPGRMRMRKVPNGVVHPLSRQSVTMVRTKRRVSLFLPADPPEKLMRFPIQLRPRRPWTLPVLFAAIAIIALFAWQPVAGQQSEQAHVVPSPPPPQQPAPAQPAPSPQPEQPQQPAPAQPAPQPQPEPPPPPAAQPQEPPATPPAAQPAPPPAAAPPAAAPAG